MSVPQAELPDTARIWVYGVDRPLDDGKRETLTDDLLDFLDHWTAHGAGLEASVELVEHRFVIIAVDETAASASGCSIDAMVRRLADLGRQLGCSLLDGALVFYRSAGGVIESCDRSAFRMRLRDGTLTAATCVFDLTIGTLGEFRAGGLELPLARSWHRRLMDEAHQTS